MARRQGLGFFRFVRRTTVALVLPVLRLLRRLYMRLAASSAAQVLAPVLRNALPALYSLHLALFFLGSPYYLVAHRLVGVRHIFNRAVTEPRARYDIIGLMVVAQ